MSTCGFSLVVCETRLLACVFVEFVYTCRDCRTLFIYHQNRKKQECSQKMSARKDVGMQKGDRFVQRRVA